MSLRTPVNTVVDWISLNLEFVLGPFIANTQRFIVGPVVDLLIWTPWPIVVLLTAFLGWVINGLRGVLFSTIAVLGIGALGMWDDTARTLATAGIAVVWALILGLPIGALMSWNDRFERHMTAALDIIQNIPIYLYVIPVVVVFGSGAVPGMLATVIYALPPVVRFTNVALRGVDAESVEAARSCGVTRWQLLYQVKIPLGLPTLMVAVNQAIMLSLSMAVVSAFIGTPGLGRTLLVGVQTGRLDLAVEAGLSMFLLAIIVERLVSGTSNRLTRRRTESGASALEEGATP